MTAVSILHGIMDSVAIIVGVSWICMGVICISLSIPLRQGRVRMNGIYGIRFPQSFKSDEAWFAINRFGGARLIIWSIPMVISGIIAFFVPLNSHESLALIFGCGPLVFLFIAFIQSWNFAQRF